MADSKPESFLSRWSRRKLAAARETAAPSPVDAPAAVRDEPNAADPASPTPAHGSQAPATPPQPPLPLVESLTFDSDFTVFMQSGVDPGVRQAALRKLLHDPRFNEMDGLDVYIDDYTKPSPLPAGVARTLAHARHVFAPPRTRVNAAGHVEEVPEEEAPAHDATVAAALPGAAHAESTQAASDAGTTQAATEPAQTGAEAIDAVALPRASVTASVPGGPASAAATTSIAPTPARDTGGSSEAEA